MHELFVALLIAYLSAALFFPGRTLSDPLRLMLLLLLSGVILLAPLILPAETRWLRLPVALQAVALVPKLYDFHRDAGRAWRMTLPEYLIYLPNGFDLTPRTTRKLPRSTTPREIRRLLGGLAGLAAGLALGGAAFSWPWSATPFLVEHAVKATALYLILLPLSRMGAALWRIAGCPAREFFDAPHRAVSPADFWRRWNLPARQFFYEDVFKPLGGIRSPVRATFLTFGASACVHEYLFDIVAGRFQGYQTAFFMLQAGAVALTLRWKPKGRQQALGNALTLLFLLLSSVLFFLSANAIAPFYSRGRAFGPPVF
jgi:hypothetical protein